jgi:hypothetical protein
VATASDIHTAINSVVDTRVVEPGCGCHRSRTFLLQGRQWMRTATQQSMDRRSGGGGRCSKGWIGGRPLHYDDLASLLAAVGSASPPHVGYRRNRSPVQSRSIGIILKRPLTDNNDNYLPRVRGERVERVPGDASCCSSSGTGPRRLSTSSNGPS